MSTSLEKQFMDAYDNYADALYRYVALKVRDHDTALDVVQDTFVKTWEYLHGGKLVDNLRAFLYQVARNKIIDTYRKKTTHSLELLSDEGFDAVSDPQEDYINKDNVRRVLGKLKLLSDDDQELIILRYVNNLSVGEIAQAIDSNTNTVSVRLFRARKRLLKLFQDQPLD